MYGTEANQLRGPGKTEGRKSCGNVVLPAGSPVVEANTAAVVAHVFKIVGIKRI
jgi:hypothetical protein